MPRLNSAILRTQDVRVPCDLPDLLKQYAKAAIKTQPKDLLKWSFLYFDALDVGLKPPARTRYEEIEKKNGITIQLIRLIHEYIGSSNEVRVQDLLNIWQALGLEQNSLDEILEIGDFSGTTEAPDGTVFWPKLATLMAGKLGNTLKDTMEVLCLVASNSEEYMSMVPAQLFKEMYTYLASIDGDIPEATVSQALQYIDDVARLQDGLIGVQNLRSPLCPNFQ